MVGDSRNVKDTPSFAGFSESGLQSFSFGQLAYLSFVALAE
jgi:hypothetical protein